VVNRLSLGGIRVVFRRPSLPSCGLIIPALLITGANNAELEREAGQPGAMTVMQKPVSPLAVPQFVAFSVGLSSAQDAGL
jgi:hypothetical protein